MHSSNQNLFPNWNYTKVTLKCTVQRNNTFLLFQTHWALVYLFQRNKYLLRCHLHDFFSSIKDGGTLEKSLLNKKNLTIVQLLTPTIKWTLKKVIWKKSFEKKSSAPKQFVFRNKINEQIDPWRRKIVFKLKHKNDFFI